MWLQFEPGVALEAGRIFNAPDELPDEIALLDSCLQPCNVGSDLNTEQLFDDNSIPSHQSMFAGRGRPNVIDMNLPSRWLHECLTNHDESCSAVSGTGQVP